MTMQISKILKRTVPLILAVMLIVSAMFVPTAVSAATKEEYEALGLHKTTEINFDGVTTPAEAGITTDFSTAEIVNGALHIAETTADKTLRFEAYGDIETVSMDIKVDGAKTGLPYFVFYDETYTDKNNNEVVATSLLQLSNNAANKSVGVTSKGLSSNASPISLDTISLSEAVDWTKNWITVTFNYSASFYDNTGNGSRLDTYGNAVNCKSLTTISIAANGETLGTGYDYSTGGNMAYLTSYGVNKVIYDGADNEKVSLGFNSVANTDGITIDNIKVTYRDNAAKVTTLIDEIGDVAATEESLAKIEKAEAAYAMLTDTEKAAVTNYATLTAARTSYNQLVANADVTEVVNLINAIGKVDNSDTCLAKIEAAEKAYDDLGKEKQALVTNYATLTKARKDYNAAEYGVYAATTFDFSNGSTDGITSDFGTFEVKDGALHIENNGTGKTLRFDAYGNIDTVSMDIKVDSLKALPDIVFYDETYTDKSSNTIEAESYLSLTPNATDATKMGATSKGLGASASFWGTQTLSKAVDWTKEWVTLTIKYGTTYLDQTSNNDQRVDAYGNNLVAKSLDTVSISVAGETVWSITMGTNPGNLTNITSYGVNHAIYDGEDNTSVAFGFNSNSNTTGIYVDNIKVTYRDNATKVTALIDEIGDVAATEESLAKIEKAETAYAMLTDTEKAAVTNYATLTAARAAYDTLMQNSDVTEVVNLIDAIGTVDASDTCLAKIKAAEEAYDDLGKDKQALVTNYATLTKARKDYNAAKYGLYADTTFDFATDLSGITSDFETTQIVDGAMYIENNGADKNLRFDSYGNIEKYSLDIKMAAEGASPILVFYDETYTDKNGNPVEAVSKLRFEYATGNVWKLRGGGLCDITPWAEIPFTDVDWTTTWVTVTLTYGKDYAELTGQTDRYGNALYNKYLASISLTVKGAAEPFYTTTIDPNSTNSRKLTSYGVNRNLTDADDNTNVTLGFESAANTVGMYVDNIMVAHNNTAAVEAVSAINTMAIDNSAACAAKVADIADLYELLPASQKTEELTTKINSAVTALEVIKTATAENLPTMEGASVRALPSTQAQNLCFTTTMPTTAIEGYSIVEYGAVMFPTRLLEDDELTLSTSNGEYKAASASAKVGGTVPTVYTTELGGIDVSGNNCGVRISARSFVKYSNGTTEFVLYSTNDKDGYSEETPTAGINKGVANRSVFSTARAIAQAVLDTDNYPETSFGSISGTLADNATGADVLAFIYENRTRIDKIVRK